MLINGLRLGRGVNINSLSNISAIAYYAIPPSDQDDSAMIPLKLEGFALHVGVVADDGVDLGDPAGAYAEKGGLVQRMIYHRITMPRFLQLQDKWKRLNLQRPNTFEESKWKKDDDSRDNTGGTGLL